MKPKRRLTKFSRFLITLGILTGLWFGGKYVANQNPELIKWLQNHEDQEMAVPEEKQTTEKSSITESSPSVQAVQEEQKIQETTTGNASKPVTKKKQKKQKGDESVVQQPKVHPTPSATGSKQALDIEENHN